MAADKPRGDLVFGSQSGELWRPASYLCVAEGWEGVRGRGGAAADMWPERLRGGKETGSQR